MQIIQEGILKGDFLWNQGQTDVQLRFTGHWKKKGRLTGHEATAICKTLRFDEVQLKVLPKNNKDTIAAFSALTNPSDLSRGKQA